MIERGINREGSVIERGLNREGSLIKGGVIGRET